MCCRHGMLTTSGSRSHGCVDRTDVITSFKASIECDRNPTDEGYVFWPEFYNSSAIIKKVKDLASKTYCVCDISVGKSIMGRLDGVYSTEGCRDSYRSTYKRVRTKCRVKWFIVPITNICTNSQGATPQSIKGSFAYTVPFSSDS